MQSSSLQFRPFKEFHEEYNLLEKIGEGQTGVEVHRCQSKLQPNKFYALKILKPQKNVFDLTDDFNEALVQARLNEMHPNVCSFKELYIDQYDELDQVSKNNVTKFRCFYLMELCDTTLHHVIEKKSLKSEAFTLNEVRDMLLQTLIGLSYLFNGIYFNFIIFKLLYKIK